MKSVQNMTQKKSELGLSSIYLQLMNGIILNKIEQSDYEIQELKKRLNRMEQDSALLTNSRNYEIFKTGAEKSVIVKQTTDVSQYNEYEDCKKITERAFEILTEWEVNQDIKVQIQYGAVIIRKIEIIKKKDWIQANDIRKKICTLMRNVIRLNIADKVFSKRQLHLLKRGFAILMSDTMKKEDMLQLNRKFRDEGLMTMPAWE